MQLKLPKSSLTNKIAENKQEISQNMGLKGKKNFSSLNTIDDHIRLKTSGNFFVDISNCFKFMRKYLQIKKEEKAIN